MGVRIRLSRTGCRNNPFYRVMVMDSKSRRDGKHLELVGFYSPLPSRKNGGDKQLGLKVDRIKYWLSVGAEPSDTVEHILIKAGILSPPPTLLHGTQSDEAAGKEDQDDVSTLLTVNGL